MTTAVDNPPLVSVVMPAYNAERFIKDAIDSVVSQTHSRLELIIVDDGSKDSTPGIAESLARCDPRIRVIHQSNSGVSAARNAGIAVANGEFLAFLDADDILTPDSIDLRLREFGKDPEVGLVHCDLQEIDEDSHPIGLPRVSDLEGQVLKQLLNPPKGLYIFGIGSILVRSEVLKAIGGFDRDLSNGADHEFYYRVASRYRFKRAPHVAFQYRLHASGMHCNLLVLEKDALTGFSKATTLGLFESGFFRRKCYSNLHLTLAGSWWKDGQDKLRGIAHLLKAVAYYPPTLYRIVMRLLA